MRIIIGFALGYFAFFFLSLFGNAWLINSAKAYIPASAIEAGTYECPGCDTGIRMLPDGARGWYFGKTILVISAPWGYHDMPGRFLIRRIKNCSNCAD